LAEIRSAHPQRIFGSSRCRRLSFFLESERPHTFARIPQFM